MIFKLNEYFVFVYLHLFEDCEPRTIHEKAKKERKNQQFGCILFLKMKKYICTI